MTIKEQLIHEIEQAPDILVEEIFDFLLLAKIKYHQQQKHPKSFGSFIEEIVSDIPSVILEKLPIDGAEQHDHYIYGTPKKK